MSRIGCPCGNTIRDQSDGLPYKAWVIPDAHMDTLLDLIGEEVKRQIRDGITLNKDMIGDIVHTEMLSFSRYCFQCEACNRLLVEAQNQRGIFYSFAPEEEHNFKVLSPEEEK